MDLKGAKIRNIYKLCQRIESDDDITLNVNIPYYQRPYKWQQEQIDNLFKDFNDNKNSQNEKVEYFVGSVVTVQKNNGEYYDIVDGQQRITTIFLLNYMKFLLLRTYIEELLITRNIFEISSALDKLENCCVKLLCVKNKIKIQTMIGEVKAYLNQSMTDDAKDKMYTSALNAFQRGMALPEKIYDENYDSKYRQQFQTFFSSSDLSLKYSRRSYNESLNHALTNVGIKMSNAMPPSFFHTYDVNNVDEIVMQYINAVKVIFDNLMRLTGDNAPLTKCADMIKIVDSMLDNIKFCVIITGNEKDAYTLFEVLNDRALEVDDLDLIKNLFYKKYCTTSNDEDDVIDKNITTLDDIWNDAFSGVGVEKSKLIAYLGTVFLTADCNLDLKHKQRYREVIENHYFDELFTSAEYKFINASNDFKVFQMIHILTKKFEFVFQKQYVAALKAENKTGKSVTYKTMHLLLALLPSVLPALVNVILRTYIDKFANGGKTEIDIAKFEMYIDDLIDSDSEENAEYDAINDLAYTLWTTTLLAKNFEMPRQIATKVIKEVNAKKSNIPIALVSSLEQNKLEGEFVEWSSEWHYGNAAGDLKIKILFMNLLKFSKEGLSLKDKEMGSHLKHPEKIQLDHLEANIKQVTFDKYYFNPIDVNADRKQYVNSLGNFMILDSENNNHKNNLPLWKALEFYDEMGEHWIIDELKDMMNNDAYSVKVDDTIRVPKEEFFNKRKSQLQQYFLAILKRSKNQKIISLN